MKIRNGFVSNSSSSSFLISKRNLSDEQINGIYNHEEYSGEADAWSVSEQGNAYIFVSTFMDNFDMYEYLTEELNIDKNKIKWEDY